jgi:membrane-associated protein
LFSHLLHFDLVQWVKALGYVGVFLILFCESGVFFGFFFPGDSLLFTAGLLATQHVFSFPILLVLCLLAAMGGHFFGYVFGDKLGGWLLSRPDSLFFKRQYIQQAHAFFDKHGGKALILCRLVPVVRTFCPIVAGMGDMKFKRFAFFTVLGAVIWVVPLLYLGYYLGKRFPDAVHFILPFVVVIILLSISPAIYHFVKKRFFK